MDNLTAILLFGTVLAPIITGALQVVKKAVPLPRNSIPLVAVILGVLIGLAAVPLTSLEWTLRAWAGALAGLASTGLFELVVSDRPGTTKDK